MPLYEYQCKKCGHRFELIQSFSAEDPKECPVCQGEVERLISTPARPHFKGSGFYSTDYAAKPAASGKSQDGGNSSDWRLRPRRQGGNFRQSPSRQDRKCAGRVSVHFFHQVGVASRCLSPPVTKDGSKSSPGGTAENVPVRSAGQALS